MSDKNKVEFGVSNLYIGTYTVSDGTVTMGTPMHIPGAKDIKLDVSSNEDTDYADNVKYWSQYSATEITGSIEVERFTDEFKKTFQGFVATADGGIGYSKFSDKPNCYIAFQSEGDAQARRWIFYNCALGGISREYKTQEDKTEPDTESCDFSNTGDNVTGLTYAFFNPDDPGYSTLFTKPAAPALSTGA